jgi:parallel beta-helix repeat protein
MKGKKVKRVLFLFTLFILLELNIHAEASHEHKPENLEENNREDDIQVDIIVDPSSTTNYQSIQEAIDEAETGTYIYVKSGIYSEILVINKKVTLIGENAETTIVNPASAKNSYAIQIITDGVQLKNFTVINYGEGLYTTGIKISAQETTIDTCHISNTPVGIAIWGSKNNILNSYFSGCEDEGIALLGSVVYPCLENTIDNCIFSGNCDGIELQYASQNTISNCTFTENTHAGIDAIGCANNNNYFSDCTLSNNKVFGLYIAKSQGTTLSTCSFTNNKIMTTASTETNLKDCVLDELYLIEHSQVTLTDCDITEKTSIKSINSHYQITHSQLNDQIHTLSFLRNRLHQKITSFIETIRDRLYAFKTINT